MVRFLGSEDRDNFFTRAQRSRMVYEILSATTFGREKKGEVSREYTVPSKQLCAEIYIYSSKEQATKQKGTKTPMITVTNLKNEMKI